MPTSDTRDARIADLWAQWRTRVDEDFVDDPSFRERLFMVWEASDYVAQACLRYPQLLLDLRNSGRLDRSSGRTELGDGLRDQLHEVADVAMLEQRLRWFRRNEMVRIIWRDITRLASLTETLEDLSELADACVAQALQQLHSWAVSVDGAPLSDEGEPQDLIVLGMGKLGARELNLSSDIDLIFAFPRHGTTGGRRRRPNEEFFTRLGRQLINVLSKITADGFVFRVDMRLRPFGDAGPLVMSFDAFENYYGSQAREWERYAMVKARVIAGDATHGTELMAMLRPFVYRRYIDFGAIESIRSMKALISRELEKKGLSDNIKLGPGGIREIEFIGQAFQLIRGGRDTDLQIRPILPVLERLGDKGVLPVFAVQELSAAYEFLRLVENRIQAWRDEQSHNLPKDGAGRARLARSMGFPDWSEFAAELERHRQRVDQQFWKLFTAPQVAEDAFQVRMLRAWVASDATSESGVEALAEAGFSDAQGALQGILAFRNSSACRSLSTRGRERLDRLMPLLLDVVGHNEAPDVTLSRLLGLMTAIVRRTAYLDLLVENPLALSQLVRLSAASSWVVDQLIGQPLLLDELLDARRLYSPLRHADLTAELREMLGYVGDEDLEQQMDRLRQFALGNMLRVAAADLAGVIPLRVVSDYLTDIAETVLASATDIAFNHLTTRHGRPQGVMGDNTGFAIIGYGKLGGIELGYGSDLDLVFLHGSLDANAMTAGIDGRRQIANDLFYARMAQRLIHVLTTRTPAGVLYEVDMRLRPNGNAGQIVSSLRAFEHYQSNEAWTWEHQALLRARPIAGEPAVMAAFQDIRQSVLAQPRDPEQLRHDVQKMRAKMRAALDKSSATQFDLKQGSGGIADIEFMVQYHVLLWAHRYPDLLTWTDNLRLLEGLAAHRVLGSDSAELFSSIYQVFRAAYHRNSLQNIPGLVAKSHLVEERATILDLWASTMADGE